MKAPKLLVALLGCFLLGETALVSAAPKRALCVAVKPGCFATIAAAVAAAHDGDTISVGAGTYPGGITIDKSVSLVGEGATVIAGGGPVITISNGNVSLSHLTITGGLTTSTPAADNAQGGGVAIVSPSAVVTISDSVVSGNRAAPLSPNFALGGGIDDAGTLTLANTRVSDNSIDGAATVRAGGINIHPGASLTLRHSSVSGNRVSAALPNAALAVAGGISDFGGALTSVDSSVTGNSVDADTAAPGGVSSFTGGIEVTEQATATVVRATVSGNSVYGRNTAGDVLAGAGGISTDPDVKLALRDSTVDGNSVSIDVPAQGGGATAFAGGLEVEGDVAISGSRFIGNSVRATTVAGTTLAIGGGLETRGLTTIALDDSVVAANTVVATSQGGFVAAAGGGIFNGGLLALRRTRVIGNHVTAAGPFGLAQGGGIWNGVIPQPGSPQVVQLTLLDSTIAGNDVVGSPGIDPVGGGVFASEPVSVARTVIAGNRPGQCVGCP
jgi:hypothetical protein